MKNEILEILMERDGLSKVEAINMIKLAKKDIRNGADPEEILFEEFGLEIDYIFDLLD